MIQTVDVRKEKNKAYCEKKKACGPHFSSYFYTCQFSDINRGFEK